MSSEYLTVNRNLKLTASENPRKLIEKIDCIKHNPFLSGCRLRCKLLVSGMVQELLTDSSVEYYTELPNTISARGTSATSSPGTC